MRECLPFLDTYRTMCLAPQADFQNLLEGTHRPENQGLRCPSNSRRAFHTRRHSSPETLPCERVFTLITQRRKEINATRIAA